MTVLTVYQSSTNDALLATARELLSTAPSSETSVASTGALAKNGTGWIQLATRGGTSTTLSGTEPVVGGDGGIWDVTTLAGQQIIAGNWTPKVKMSVGGGSLVADIHVRIWKRSSTGVYTQFTSGGTATDCVLTAQTISTAATAFTFAATALDAMSFATGDKLYVDYVLDITTGNSNHTTEAITFYENGGANESIVTPGYAAPSTPGTGSEMVSFTGVGVGKVGVPAIGAATDTLAGLAASSIGIISNGSSTGTLTAVAVGSVATVVAGTSSAIDTLASVAIAAIGIIATASVANTLVAVGVGTIRIVSTAKTTDTLTPVATGVVDITATSTATNILSLISTGQVDLVATSGVTDTFTGVAAGVSGSSGVSGMASEDVSLTSSATGVIDISPIASESISISSTALASVEVVGIASSSVVLITSAVGIVNVSGVASQSLTLVAIAVGSVTGGTYAATAAFTASLSVTGNDPLAATCVSGSSSVSGTLTANVITTAILSSSSSWLTITNITGTYEIYFTVDKIGGACASPTIGGVDSKVIPAAIGSVNVRQVAPYGSVVGLISSGNSDYSISTY